MVDATIRELEREVERAPEDAGARLALARAFARAGARVDAAEAFYAARVLGAPASETRESLRALGGPPSPWPQLHGTAAQSRLAPVRGPRAGRVVVRSRTSLAPDDAFGIVDEDASWVTGTAGVLRRWPAETLHPRRMRRPVQATGELIPALAPRGVIVAVEGFPGARLIGFLEGLPRTIATRRPGTILLPPVVDSEGRTIVTSFERSNRAGRAEVFSPEWDLERELEPGPAPTAPALSDELLAFVASPQREPLLRVFGRDGRLLFEKPLPERLIQGPCIDARGRVVVLVHAGREESGWTYLALGFEPDGRLAWSRERPSGWIARIAADPVGGVLLAAGGTLERLDERGKVAWARPRAGHVFTGLVVDRAGVVYSALEHGQERALVAHGLDGAVVFEAAGDFHPLALDGRGRLLALSDGHLVAVA